MLSIFSKNLLNQYQLVNKPGVYLVRVAYSTTIKNIIYDEHPRLLVPLRAVTPDGLSEIITALNKSPKIPFRTIRHLFLTGAIFESHMDLDAFPMKGDLVLASFKKIDDGRLVCDNLEQLPREELPFINADELLKFNIKLLNIIQHDEIN